MFYGIQSDSRQRCVHGVLAQHETINELFKRWKVSRDVMFLRSFSHRSLPLANVPRMRVQLAFFLYSCVFSLFSVLLFGSHSQNNLCSVCKRKSTHWVRTKTRTNGWNGIVERERDCDSDEEWPKNRKIERNKKMKSAGKWKERTLEWQRGRGTEAGWS